MPGHRLCISRGNVRRLEFASAQSTADLKERVNELVALKTGFPIGEIRPEKRLLHDLGITWDDAAELLTEIAREFNIDLKGFPFDRFVQVSRTC